MLVISSELEYTSAHTRRTAKRKEKPVMEEAENQPRLLAEEGFIFFPEEVLDVGKVFQSPYGILYAEIGGKHIQLDEQTADPEARVWYTLVEDEKLVILGNVEEE
jgi:hypothetical protein